MRRLSAVTLTVPCKTMVFSWVLPEATLHGWWHTDGAGPGLCWPGAVTWPVQIDQPLADFQEICGPRAGLRSIGRINFLN